jgi:hypothetical protein
VNIDEFFPSFKKFDDKAAYLFFSSPPPVPTLFLQFDETMAGELFGKECMFLIIKLCVGPEPKKLGYSVKQKSNPKYFNLKKKLKFQRKIKIIFFCFFSKFRRKFKGK